MQRHHTESVRRGRAWKGACCCWVVLGLGLVLNPVLAGADPSRWESEISRFEQMDRESGIVQGQILFLGSSSIRLWDLEASFPDLDCLNRGFGGSEISDSLHYFDRLVPPYAPRTIVFYAGDNDIAAGESPDQVFADFEQFCTRAHAALPQTTIIFIASKPSPARWALVGQMRQVNRRVAERAGGCSYLKFLDIDAPMIGADGHPRSDLFREDGLHLNAKGYEIWSAALRPLLVADRK